MPELDNIPILRNEMYTKPVKEKGIKKEKDDDDEPDDHDDEKVTYIDSA